MVVGGGGLLFFRIHAEGVIGFFCDAGRVGQDILFSYLLIEFCQPTPGHK